MNHNNPNNKQNKKGNKERKDRRKKRKRKNPKNKKIKIKIKMIQIKSQKKINQMIQKIFSKIKITITFSIK